MKDIFKFTKEVKNEWGTETVLDYPKVIKLSLIILFILVILFGGVRTIKSGQVGIKTRFGKVVDTQMNEGINFKIPLIEKIVKMNIRVQKVEIDTESSSKDLQTVQMKLAVNYKVDGTKATKLFKNVGTKYEDVILQPAIQESIKAVTSKYTAEELITNRGAVSKDCMEILQKKVKHYGIIIDNFNITNFNFSAEFNKAIEEKQVAEQKVLTAKQELEKEKIEAEKKVVKAEAERKANELKQASLTDNLIKEEFISKWNGTMPSVIGGNGIFDITSFIK